MTEPMNRDREDDEVVVTNPDEVIAQGAERVDVTPAQDPVEREDGDEGEREPVEVEREPGADAEGDTEDDEGE